jgi:hypothetical protein
MAGELQTVTTSGLTVYCVLLNENGLIYNGAAFEVINGANWLTYDIAMVEGAAGIYLADMPVISAGAYRYVAYEQLGVNPAVTDTLIDGISVVWGGTEMLDFTQITTISLGISSISSSLKQYSVLKRHLKCDQIEIRRSTDASVEVYGVGDLTGRTTLYFTVKYMKEKDSATDAQAIIQIEETAGLLYINQNAAETPANGSITVTDALAGTMTIELSAEETDKLLPNERYVYDIKMDNEIMAEGTLLVTTAVTRTVT